MAISPFHLGWFVDLRPPSVNRAWSGSSNYDWPNVFFVDMARALDRAKFDFMLFPDAPRIDETYGAGFGAALSVGQFMLDPMAIAPILAHQTRGIGIFPTTSVTDWNPYTLARLLASMDAVTNGRIGWNMITGGNESTAANMGFDPIPHDTRYELANEFVDAVTQLWDSWEPGAVVFEHPTGMRTDGSKVHAINFKGKYFRTRGPLTMPRSPQGRPVLAQAGASGVGRDFASRFADVVLGSQGSVEGMKAYREDILARATKFGRDASQLRVLFLIQPHLGDWQAEAEERFLLRTTGPQSVTANLVVRSAHWNVDLSTLDLDKPLPADLKTEGHQAELDLARASGKTLRELASSGYADGLMHLIGTPETVAGQMEEIMQEVGGDGFLIVHQWVDRRVIVEVTDGLVPVLQRRGLVRREYDSPYFRGNLFAF